MNNLVIDLTHGGVKIAISLAKKGHPVLAYDIYSTLSKIDAKMLEIYNVELVELEDLSDFRGDMRIIYPIHLPLTREEIISHNPDLNYTFKTHHEIVKELLKDWGEDIPKIEITGVKGKTSSVFMLKEILIDRNPLILSSLGALLYEDGNEIILKKDISITPANIKETVDLAYKIANPVCKIAEGSVKSQNLRKYSSAIFECSLGTTGIGDVGLLTNISENYPIAKNHSCASEAKKQIFGCRSVVANKESLDKHYADVVHDKVNSFSVNDIKANAHAASISYSLDRTKIEIVYDNVKTVNDNTVNGKIFVETFAPGPHHVENVLGVVLTCLTLEIPADKITEGLNNFKGIAGRTNKKIIENSTIIEEINPGINTDAIRKSVDMIGYPDDYYIAIGGDYGITCEEIDEEKLSHYIDTTDCRIILTGDVGLSLSKKISKNAEYLENPNECYDLAIKNKKNLLFIYRSNYSNLSQR